VARKLASLEAQFLYGHFSLTYKFTEGVNVIFGNNGGGKTTLLNILANALNGQFNQFAFLDFSKINIEFDDGRTISISKFREQEFDSEEIISVSLDDDVLFSIPVSRVSAEYSDLSKIYLDLIEYELPYVIYFPAYRTLYDYLNLTSGEDHQMLSAFSPVINFPSLKEIEEQLRKESKSTTVSTETIMFIESVNKFFENKKLKLNLGSTVAPFELVYDDNKVSRQLTSLSSGERQITTILYAVSQAKQGGIVLVDEPEISLHLEWQRKILRVISSLFQPEQIIACTHSPVIGADFELKELDFRFVGR